MKRLLNHIRNNMTHDEFQNYCEDFITGCVIFIVVMASWGLWL